MKKIFLKRAVKISALLTAVLLFLIFSQEYLFLRPDNNSNRMRLQGFYMEDKNSLDVVFLGASEIYSGFSPGLAYDEYGFTSYAFTTSGNPVSLYKSQLDEILKYQSPKMIVVEVNGALYDTDKVLTKDFDVGNYIENIPMSSNKIKTVSDLIPLKKQPIYYFPIVRHHNTWKAYPKKFEQCKTLLSTQLRGYSLLKGEATRTNVMTSDEGIINYRLANDNSTLALMPKSEKYFRDFLQYCKDKNISNILFVRFPHRIYDGERNGVNMYDSFKRSNEIGRIISEYGFEYINFEKAMSETGLDICNDFYNDNHLNIYGEQKMTRHMSDILCERYGITETALTEKQAKRWNKCADYTKRYFKYADEKIKSGHNEWVFETYDLIKELENQE